MFTIRHYQSGLSGARVVVALLLLVFTSAAFSATLNVRVETDKSVYKIGDTVKWRIYAWSGKDNYGVQAVSVAISESTSDVVNPPLVEGTEFKNTAYKYSKGFQILYKPVTIYDIFVIQMPPYLNPRPQVGNDGRTDHILAIGSYTVQKLGEHRLSVTFNGDGGNYWPTDSTGTLPPAPFETLNAMPPASFTVAPDADVNEDMYVNFKDFAMIAANWQIDDCGRLTDCGRTDINGDGRVNLTDIMFLADQWLTCTNPADPDCR